MEIFVATVVVTLFIIENLSITVCVEKLTNKI
jgi:hypothetical protein